VFRSPTDAAASDRLCERRDARWWWAAVALTACCGGLVGARYAMTGQLTYLFLAKNLGLAWCPAVLAFALRRQAGMPGLAFAGAMGAWLVFHPNAPYLVTDLIHLATPRRTVLWMDVLILGVAAAAGLMLALASAQWVAEAIGRRRGRPLAGPLVVALAAGLGALGVYFGRFARWNSWEVVTRPGDLVADGLARLARPELWIFVGLFGACLAVAHGLFLGLTESPSGPTPPPPSAPPNRVRSPTMAPPNLRPRGPRTAREAVSPEDGA
jgi:uncharacterized membrane protein